MTTRTDKGERRREQLAHAAAALVLREGPAALTHRRVAAEAGASLSATTYYFADLDDLAAAAGAAMVEEWAAHAAHTLATLTDGAAAADPDAPADRRAAVDRTRAADAVVDAVLPPGDDDAVRRYYEHLLGSARNPALARAFAAGRAQVDAVVERVVARVGLGLPAAVAVALVDGAVVSALTEARPLRATARTLLLDATGHGRRPVADDAVPRTPAAPDTTTAAPTATAADGRAARRTLA